MLFSHGSGVSEVKMKENIPMKQLLNWIRNTVGKKVRFCPETGPEFPQNDKNPKHFETNLLKTPIGINWPQNVLDFHHFGEILFLFRVL